MLKKLLPIAIGACLTSGSVIAAESGSDDSANRSQESRTYLDRRLPEGDVRSQAYNEDNTSTLRAEPCPDKFDTAWSKTNDADEPCLNTRTKELQLPDGSEYTAQPEPADEDGAPEPVVLSEPKTSEFEDEQRVTDARCEEEDLSDQAVAQNAYQSELEMREAGEKRSIGSEFDPELGIAISVSQLRDSDVQPQHIDATFASIDDDRSGGVDKIEALDVRGLADIFEDVDRNNDRVVSPAEFDIHFTGTLDDPLCLDGERISSLSELESRKSS